MALVLAGIISTVAVSVSAMPGAWDTIFTLLSLATVIALAIVAELSRVTGAGDYLGRLVTGLGRRLGRPLETSRVVRFLLDVEDVLLDLLRGDRRRLDHPHDPSGGLLPPHRIRSLAGAVGSR